MAQPVPLLKNDVFAWLSGKALPLWSGVGFDRKRSAFQERLTLQGVPIEDAPRRLTVQARQIYVYARATDFGWMKGADEIVSAATDAMIRDYFEPDGNKGWVFSVDAKGSVADPKRELYAHAFALLGLASAYRVTKDKKYLDYVDRTLEFIDTSMPAKAGGYISSLPDTGVLLQNPHMHLLESLLELHSINPDKDYGDRAKLIIGLFEKKFFQSRTGTLSEYFDDKWQPASGERGRLFEPGHHYEWIWLLNRYSKLMGVDTSSAQAALAATAAKWGTSPSGRLWNEVRDDGVATNTSSRLWPYTEAIKAASVDKDPARRKSQADKWLEILYEAYLKPAYPGGWLDQFDAHGKSMTEFMPASSFYHIVCALGEYAEVFGA